MMPKYPEDHVTSMFKKAWMKSGSSKSDSSESESESGMQPPMAQNLESEIEIEILTLKEIKIKYRKSENLKIHEVVRKYDDFQMLSQILYCQQPLTFN